MTGSAKAMSTLKRIWSKIKADLYTYETPKMVEIESKFVGIFNWMMRFILLIVIIVWIFIIQQGYQKVDEGAVGAFTTKVKGIAYTNSSDVRVGSRLWDAADLHISPQDTSSFFIATNLLITHNQSQSECVNPNDLLTNCSNDADCPSFGTPDHISATISTGICNTSIGFCIMRAWCPPEDDSLPENGAFAVLHNIQDFTVFLKHDVYFPLFKRGRSNLIESVTSEQLSSGCLYDHENDPYCPIFRIGALVGMATRSSDIPDDEKDDQIFRQVAVKGGIVTINVKWDCNYDRPDSACKPEYGFERQDKNENAASTGYNFRFINLYSEDGVGKRQLIKAFGILFLLHTEASARAFNVTTFLLNIGSGLGLLGISAIVCDILLLNIHKHREFFRKHKNEEKLTYADRSSHHEGSDENVAGSTNVAESTNVTESTNV